MGFVELVRDLIEIGQRPPALNKLTVRRVFSLMGIHVHALCPNWANKDEVAVSVSVCYAEGEQRRGARS